MADKKDNLTIYQKLYTVFGQGGGTARSNTNLNPKYNLTDKDLIVTKSREDFERQKLQLQQQKYLDSQWQKIENDMYQKATYYETTRLASYMDYEAMEFTPEIAVALETMSEESCTLNEQGQIMSIYSDSSRIKKVLEDLFFNVLDIHSNLPMWTRNTCKYGDNFVHLKLNYKYGVIGATQLTNIEISRSDSNSFDYNETNSTTNEDNKKEVKFEWKSKNLAFNAWEVAHFRLLGDDRKLPYGTSVLDKVRRTWRQLLLAEDAMLVYRVTRAPERRVFKVYVGNIDDEDVESYVQKVANKFKRTQTADNNTGQLDVRYNTLAVDQDYFVPVRDPNSPNPIETLPGATNLDQIADIQFIQRKMVTALRVPKTFLGFEEPTGEGKNLALMDIRFARTINRIQQAMIQELNKIAIVHLYMLGFHEELSNFKLSLNNPSTQGEMLKVEQWKEKVLLYKDLVAATDGIAPTSHTWAKKNIFNWSEDEIKLDLEQQRLEKAAAAELEKTPEVITKTGYFDKVDKLYGDIMTQKMGDTESEDTGGFGDEDTGGGFGGDTGGFGGDTGGFGDEDAGGFGGDEAGGGEFGEGFRGDEDVIDKLLLEGKKKNEDIIMMTSGIDELLNEENFDEKDILT
jgi:predicted CopG family antitoxin